MKILHIIIVVSLALWTNQSSAEEVTELENLVTQWLQIEKQTSSLESNWTEQRASMQQRLQILAIQQKQLLTLTEKSSKSGGELEKTRSDLITQQNQLEQQQTAMSTWLDATSKQLLSMQVQLPAPLIASWQASGDLTNSSLTASEKLPIILAQLTSFIDFQHRLSTHQMAILDKDGQQIWVKQLYLGASQAWFVSADFSYAGVGYATPLGWRWQFDDTIEANSIAKTIAMVEKKQSADWMTLPVRSYHTKESLPKSVQTNKLASQTKVVTAKVTP